MSGSYVRILADSINPCGNRLTTFECRYWRAIHAEMLTHRAFSRNSASNRAIPIEKVIEAVQNDPAMPVYWGSYKAGMQAGPEIAYPNKFLAQTHWQVARNEAVAQAKQLVELGLHKQIVNRLLEPFQFITTIITATEYGNFFKLRCHKDAQPEIKWVADEMYKLYVLSNPIPLDVGQWHQPLLKFDDSIDTLGDVEKLNQLSIARCARVSYLTHDGKRSLDKDYELFNRLLESKHLSPFEHVAVALSEPKQCANFVGWQSYRNKLGE